VGFREAESETWDADRRIHLGSKVIVSEPEHYLYSSARDYAYYPKGNGYLEIAFR